MKTCFHLIDNVLIILCACLQSYLSNNETQFAVKNVCIDSEICMDKQRIHNFFLDLFNVMQIELFNRLPLNDNILYVTYPCVTILILTQDIVGLVIAFQCDTIWGSLTSLASVSSTYCVRLRMKMC